MSIPQASYEPRPIYTTITRHVLVEFYAPGGLWVPSSVTFDTDMELLICDKATVRVEFESGEKREFTGVVDSYTIDAETPDIRRVTVRFG